MRLLLTLACCVTLTVLHAQGRSKQVDTDSGRVVLHYFSTGQLSTVEWMDKDERFGRSRAFSRDGRVIVDHHTRRIAGHASVHFSYHPNGAVSRSEFSDAPDAGIQWYESTTTFDEQGNRTGFSEQGHDDRHVIPGPGTTFTAPLEPIGPGEEPVREPEVAICQKLFVNEVFVVNPTKWPCVLKVEPRMASPALPAGSFTMEPGDSLRIGAYSTGEAFDDPDNQLTLSVPRSNNKGRKGRSMYVDLQMRDQVSTEHRRYYYHIRLAPKPMFRLRWLKI